MSKSKIAFFCKNCGAESPKWQGKCPSCNEWNTFIEEVIQKETKQSDRSLGSDNKNTAKLISEIDLTDNQRIIFNDNELNRVLGGGLVNGALILLGGEPGIGKSTLMLQLALRCTNLTTLYISGEESEQQLRIRAERLNLDNPGCYVLTETSVDKVLNQIKKIKPDIIIIDSIQTLYTSSIDSLPGSVTQIRECTAILNKYAKENMTSIFIIGHITKDGSIAGPKLLEHMVDTVLQFEGEKKYQYRILRSIKNRFGPTSELAIYEMRNSGLKEVTDLSRVLITQREDLLSGISIAATIEGIRPILIEVQALVSSAAYGTPQRSATGFDIRRLNMLLAVLEKRCGFKIGIKDVFLNITGGIKVDDPAIDLAVICAILSSSEDISIPNDVCFSGEVGLSGEIRPVNKIVQRISEAEKLGFKKIFVSAYNLDKDDYKDTHIEVVNVDKVEDVFSILFG